MSDEEPVLLDVTAGGVATVTLNRPELHNSFSDDVIERLADIFDDLAKQDGVRVVIIEGRGASFCAGADLNWMRRAADFTEEQNLEDATALGYMLRSLNSMPKPTIALVHGSAYAGGVGLVAACDVAVAARNAVFCLTEVKIGLVPAVISPYVIEAIGAHNARRYFLTAERFPAHEAYRMGLVHEIVDDRAGLEAARDRLLGHFLAGAPGALAETKDLIFAVRYRRIDSELVLETARRIASRRVTEEGREGIASFLEKRKPRWTETD
ncbi:MAG TPA: enoyl-CoA hydratase-related protein [Candidatus Sulfotelmatobacter sp.]|nr:enoyl-CoA hydratase-related protein [Candidatus Sulfotelmatobacter sp.]